MWVNLLFIPLDIHELIDSWYDFVVWLKVYDFVVASCDKSWRLFIFLIIRLTRVKGGRSKLRAFRCRIDIDSQNMPWFAPWSPRDQWISGTISALWLALSTLTPFHIFLLSAPTFFFWCTQWGFLRGCSSHLFVPLCIYIIYESLSQVIFFTNK